MSLPPLPSATRRQFQILIVEDNPDLSFGLKLNLEGEGYDVRVEADGVTARTVFFQARPDLVILDLMLPDLDGIDLLKQWRAVDEHTRILVLSARVEETSRVAALRLGADDYVCKPFGVAELLARVANQLKHSNGLNPMIVRLSSAVVDMAARTVRKDGRLVELTTKEFLIWSVLYARRGSVVSKEQIHAAAWDNNNTPSCHAWSFK